MKNFTHNTWIAFGLALSFFLPVISFAAEDGQELLVVILEILQGVVTLLVMVALLVFFYGVAKFILAAGNAEVRKQGIQTMIYGVIALFVIVSVWGLVAILQSSFLGFGGADVIRSPQAFLMD